MTDMVFNPKGRLIIEDVYAWMDGGTVTLIATDVESNNFEIEFVQKVFFGHQYKSSSPGSLLLNKREVEIRSELESEIISSVKEADWGPKIIEKEKQLMEQMISDCIEFVMSDEYIEVAKKIGRVN